MRKRYLGGLAALVGSIGMAVAQPSIYPFPPQSQSQPQSQPPTERPTFVPKALPQQAAASQQAVTPAPAAPGAVNWYPNPTPNPIRQAKVDGTPPPAPAPAPSYAPPPPIVVGQDCPDPTAPHMRDVQSACDTCSTSCLCGPPGRVWFGAEYLRWTTKGNPLPPLLTTAPAGTPLATAGTVGDPGTTVLVGGNNANNNWRNGLRIYGGLWLDDDQTCGLEASYFFLGRSNYNASVGSDGSQILTRPFTDNAQFNPAGGAVAVPGFANTELVSFPGVVAGTATVNSTSDFTGFGANAIKNLVCCPNGRLDLLLGYRFLYLKDTLTVQEDLTGLAGSGFPGARFLVTDSFRTKNYFNGVNGGLNYERRFGRFYLGTRATVALGVTHNVTDIDGSTQTTDTAGGVAFYRGGLLAQNSNIGHYTGNSFSVVPEVGAKLGMQVTDHLRVFAGYDYLYWSNVTRTGGVIDTRVNSSQLPPSGGVVGARLPAYNPGRTDFYAHGLTAGLELRY